MPFEFAPSSPQGGTVGYDVSTSGVHWTGGGTYSVQGSDTERPSIDGQIVDGCAATPFGTTCKGFPFHLDLTPLETNECAKP